MIAMVKIRELDTDEEFSLRGSTIQRAVEVSIQLNKSHEKQPFWFYGRTYFFR